MQTQEQDLKIQTGYFGRISGLIDNEFIDRCPVCANVTVCYMTDKFHNCNVCGSTWRNPDY